MTLRLGCLVRHVLGIMRGLLPLSTIAQLALCLSGCGCLSSELVQAKVERLRLQNRDRAEPAMLAAASARGAFLLPLEPQDIPHRLPCMPGSDESMAFAEPSHDVCLSTESDRLGCQQWSEDGRYFLLRQKGEQPQLALPVRGVEGSTYARVARRGNRLIILLPRLTSREQLGTVTECECDGMPRVQCASTFGFLLNEVPTSVEIEEIWVPMAEGYLRRKCKAFAV